MSNTPALTIQQLAASTSLFDVLTYDGVTFKPHVDGVKVARVLANAGLEMGYQELFTIMERRLEAAEQP